MSVVDRLARLREEDAGRGAPEQVEATVMAAFRARRRRVPRTAWWLAGAAAAVLIALGLWSRVGQAPSLRRPLRPPADRAASPVHAGWEPAAGRGPAPQHRVSVRRVRRKPHVVQKADAPFIAVPYAPPLPSNEIQIVRVRLPVDGMNEADVVTGVDGIVRAVRWVR